MEVHPRTIDLEQQSWLVISLGEPVVSPLGGLAAIIFVRSHWQPRALPCSIFCAARSAGIYNSDG